jgi:RimJ/RimL family protein N-acetyltransferase
VPLRSGRVEVRRIEVGEGERLRALRLAALRADPGAFGATLAEDEARPARHWDMLGGGPGAVFVGGDWEGMAGVYLDGEVPQLWGMWVAPSARGRGLGRALAEAVTGWARDRGFERLQLSVSDAAPGAAALYERLGFVRTGAARPLESDPSLTQHDLALALPAPERRIETARLLLRPFEPADLEVVHDMRSREDMLRWLYEEAGTLESARVRLEGRRRRVRFGLSGDGLGFAAVLGDGTVVGDLSLTLTSAEHRQGEVGFLVHPDHQGRGYATEAAAALLDLAFGTFALHRVVGRLEARNVASGRVLEKLGMRREAHLVENELVKGEWQSELVYAVLRASRGA